MKKTEGRNHWIEHEGDKWQLDDKYDGCFPKYKTKSKEEAIEKYWDEYYKISEMFEQKYPNNFKVFNMKYLLNTKEGIENMFDFIGIDNNNIRYIKDIKLNSTDERKNS